MAKEKKRVVDTEKEKIKLDYKKLISEVKNHSTRCSSQRGRNQHHNESFED
jgi:hypothetical protein